MSEVLGVSTVSPAGPPASPSAALAGVSCVNAGLASIHLLGALLCTEVCPSSLLCWPLFHPMGTSN